MKTSTMILGGGLAGLSTAHLLGGDYLVVERDAQPGGLLASEITRGYTFDVTGHWLHLRDERTRRFAMELLPEDAWETTVRRSKIFSHGVMTEYPFQANLHGLPLPIVRDCLVDFVHAREKVAAGAPEPESYRDFVALHFGEAIGRHFMEPYNTKMWGVPLDEITADWCGRFVPIPSVEAVIDGSIGHQAHQVGYNASFIHPRTSGIQALTDALAARVSPLALETYPTAVDVGEKWVELSDGRRVQYDHLVSTIPLDVLVELVVDCPDDVREAASKLRCSTLRYINLGLREPFLPDLHWIYVPEYKYPIYRVGMFSNAVATMAPEGCTSCYVEIAAHEEISDEHAGEGLRELLADLGVRDPEAAIEVEEYRTIEHAYVIFDDNYFDSQNKCLAFLASHGVHSIGRYGRWIYSSMEDSILHAMETVDTIRSCT